MEDRTGNVCIFFFFFYKNVGRHLLLSTTSGEISRVTRCWLESNEKSGGQIIKDFAQADEIRTRHSSTSVIAS